MMKPDIKIRELDIDGYGIAADQSNLAAQLEGIIQRFDTISTPLTASQRYVRTLHDPHDDPGAKVNILVHPDGTDATCIRVSKAYADSLISRPEGGEAPGDDSTRIMRVSDRPVYFIGRDGKTIERIIYRRG